MKNSADTQVTNSETQENNKLIAEFMRVKPRLISPDVYGYSDSPFFNCIHDTPEKVIESISKYAKYRSEWNWLMPVIQKITTTEEFQNKYEDNDYFWEIFNQLDMDEIYTQVILFIEWYNENN